MKRLVYQNGSLSPPLSLPPSPSPSLSLPSPSLSPSPSPSPLSLLLPFPPPLSLSIYLYISLSVCLFVSPLSLSHTPLSLYPHPTLCHSPPREITHK